MSIGKTDLSELHYTLKNTFYDPTFLGGPCNLLLEELLLTLDAPLISIEYGSTPITNALKDEYEFIKNHETNLISQKKVKIDTALINNCVIEIYSLESLRYDATNREKFPLRLRLQKIRGYFSLTFSYTQKLDVEVIKTICCFLDQDQLQHLDNNHDPYLKTDELANCIGQCITEIHQYQQLLPVRSEAFASRVPSIPKYDPEFLRAILSETKQIVEHLLSGTHEGFSGVLQNGMLLQFFIKDISFPDKAVLRFVPTDDQLYRFREAANDILASLRQKKLDKFLEQDKDPLDAVKKYQWDERRSLAGYVCSTNCSMYTNNWLREPLALGDHLSPRDRSKRGIISAIMEIVQQRNNVASSFLLTVPWVLGTQVFGALQINATADLPLTTIRKTVHLIKRVFNQSELELRHSEYFGNLKAINQMRAHLIMLEHDAPQFLSTPIINTIQNIQTLIESRLLSSSEITKESLIEGISNRMAQLKTLATHYDVFLHTLMGTAIIRKTAELLADEEFAINECTETVRTVFGVFIEQKSLIVDETFLQYLNRIHLEINISELQGAKITGAKSLLTEVLLNLLSNSLTAITSHNKDSTKNPLRLDLSRGVIELSISPESTKQESFLKIAVKDYGIGISESVLNNIQLRIDEAELDASSSYIKAYHFLNGMPIAKGGRKRYGLLMILETLYLLSMGKRFRRPEIKSKVSEGTLVEIFFPVESVKF